MSFFNLWKEYVWDNNPTPCHYHATIPRFVNPDILDVDYIDITNHIITNPSRLLPIESIHPFWVENRLRKHQFYKLFELVNRVSDLIRQSEEVLHIPRGNMCCAEKWENELSDIVWEAFYNMKEAVDDAVFDFSKKFNRPAWYLYRFHGCTTQEFQTKMAECDKAKYRSAIFQAFLHDLKLKNNTTTETIEDLPF